jgi:hypothetical protein
MNIMNINDCVRFVGATGYFVEDFQGCSEFLRHKTIMMAPTKLAEGRVPYVECLQVDH